jgi:O-antigen ligase
MILLYYGYNFFENTSRTDISTLVLDSSSLYRFEIWRASWDLFKESVLFGNGPGSVSKLLSYSSDKLKGYIFHSHNITLHLLAETGIFGLLAFCALVLSAVRKFRCFWKEYKHSDNSYVAIGFIAALTAMLVHGMVDCAVFIPSRSLIFLVYLSLFPALCINSYNKLKI